MSSRTPLSLLFLRRTIALPQIACSSSRDFSTRERQPRSKTVDAKKRKVIGFPAHRGGASFDDLILPKKVTPSRLTVAGGDDFSKGLDEPSMSIVLDEFIRRQGIRELAEKDGLTAKLFMTAYKSFRSHCLNEIGGVEPAVLIVFQDIIKEGHDVDRLYPLFLTHARKVFPHLEAMDDLKIISDLSQPHNWYPEARNILRKIIFHSGPTNSGKTYNALKRFSEAKTGVYCGPLKLLAAEVFTRSNANGLKCDMVTGEERRYAIDNLHPSAHLSCTVEMLSTQMQIEVAVIDEIQMLRDEQRGWAWTRALLGVAAEEVHLCGEPAAIEIVRKLLEPTGEHLEVRHYERKTPLAISSEGLGNLDNVQPGDCIVCFNKRAIFDISRKLEKIGIKPALIYGDLPPGTKLAQAAKFNDPNDPCKVMVSTDAIGMGLNLNIRRVIFHSCTRKGELLPVHSALQIAGRAGRFGTTFAEGVATTLNNEDIGTLREILAQQVETISAVGISPTFDQIESFHFHLPQASFVRLLDLFISVCSLSKHFFICTVEQMREMANLIDGISLPLKVRYTFCISPLNVDSRLVATTFVKMARRFSSGQALTCEWLLDILEWNPQQPTSIQELVLLEQTYEILDGYLWLSLRFPDMLPDEAQVRQASKELDSLIQEGIENILQLLENDLVKGGKEGSLAKKLQDKAQTAREKEEYEQGQSHSETRSVDKRRGKRKTVLETLVEKTGLTPEEIEALKKELRE